jgi:hypothetical protein
MGSEERPVAGSVNGHILVLGKYTCTNGGRPDLEQLEGEKAGSGEGGSGTGRTIDGKTMAGCGSQD